MNVSKDDAKVAKAEETYNSSDATEAVDSDLDMLVMVTPKGNAPVITFVSTMLL